MSGDTAWLAHVVPVLMAATLVGLFVTSRIGLCPTFAVYVGLSLLREPLAAWWPVSGFATLQVWLLFELSVTLLALLVVLEVSCRALTEQPRARWLLIGGMVGAAVMSGLNHAGASGLMGVPLWVPALAPYCLLAVYLAVLVVVRLYRLALHPLHRVILVTFVLSLGVHAAMMLVFDGTQAPEVGNAAQGLRLAAACATTALWAWAAWAPTTTFDLPE